MAASEMSEAEEAWEPGFESVQGALRAGQKFFARTDGTKGRFGRDFHIVKNEHGRFHFQDGPPLRAALASTEDGR